MDELDRPSVVGVEVALKFAMMQANQAASQEIAQLPTTFSAGAQFSLSFADGNTWTITESGIAFDYQNVGDFNGLKVIEVTGGGIVPVSSFNAIITA